MYNKEEQRDYQMSSLSGGPVMTGGYQFKNGNNQHAPAYQLRTAKNPAQIDGINSVRPRVLVIDDDLTLLQLAQDRLTDEGFEIITASDGESALQLFIHASTSAQAFKAVLLDVEMPGIDGFQVCERIRALPDGLAIPIIIISGQEDRTAAQKAYEVRATDFSNKPTDWLVLAQRLRYVLRASAAFSEVKRNHQRLADAQRATRIVYWEFDPLADQIYIVKADGALQEIKNSHLFSFHNILRHVHPADRAAVENYYKKITGQQPDVSAAIEYRVLEFGGDGKSYHTFHTEAHRDINGEESIDHARRIYGLTQDITKIRLNEEKIQQLSHFDELTGLHNRSAFLENLTVALELNKTSQAKLATFLVNLDAFKRVNESFGHHIGDALIQAFVQRAREDFLANKIINQDIGPKRMARLGGDEFAIMLNVGNEDPKIFALRVAEQLKESTRKAFTITAEGSASDTALDIMISLSIGIAIYPDDGANTTLLLKNADTALNNAKRNGKNQHQFYNNAMSVAGRARLDLEIELRRAIEQEQLELYYQPQVSASSGKLTGVEALVRWNHPQRGRIPSAKFIPLAEESGLILPMSNWIVSEACQQSKRWGDSALEPFTVAINLSGMQFRQSDFKQNIEAIFAETSVDPSLICLELTESVIMGDAENTIATLHGLKELGVKLSIDDFGTGYSSLSYLQKFPLDTLKVDRSFITDIGENSDNMAITEAIIAMGHSLGLQIIAEGVETQAQLDFLIARSCEVIQGFFFSKAIPASEIPAFAKNSHRL